MERTSGSTSSTDSATERPGAARVIVGRVRGAHGLRGQLRVHCFGDAADLSRLEQLVLSRTDAGEAAETYEVDEVAPGRGAELRVSLRGVEGRDAAEALKGCFVWARARELGPTDDGEYYGFELIGCRVQRGDGGEIGVVRDIWSTGAPAVLVVQDASGAEQLIPTAREILREVDVGARRIVIDAPPGLLQEPGNPRDPD